MAETTVRLRGRALRRFFERLMQSRPELDPDARAALARDLGHMLAGAKVRRIAWAELARRKRMARRLKKKPPVAPKRASPTDGHQFGAATPDRTVAKRAAKPKPAETPTGPATAASVATPVAAGDAGNFDPYAFGLIPIYQRGGGDALREKLATVDSVDHLRKMARAQQIGLPSEIRRGSVDAAAVRDAIIVAVEKRIADRRAAAS